MCIRDSSNLTSNTMEILIEYGLFVLKAFTIIVLIFIPIFFLVSSMRQPPETNESLKIKTLKQSYFFMGMRANLIIEFIN